MTDIIVGRDSIKENELYDSSDQKIDPDFSEVIYRAWCKNCLKYYDRQDREDAQIAMKVHIEKSKLDCDYNDARLHLIPIDQYVKVVRGWKKEKAEAFKKYNISEADLSQTKEVVRGNDEVAYWLKHSDKQDAAEIYIAVQLKHNECPKLLTCKYKILYESTWEWRDVEEEVTENGFTYMRKTKKSFYVKANNKRPESERFHEMFDHFVNIHYDLTASEHTQYDNQSYAMLQQLVKFEANKSSKLQWRSPGYHKKCEVIYELNSSSALPLGLVGELLGYSKSYYLLGKWSYQGMLRVKGDIPQWAKNVYAKLEEEKKGAGNKS